MSRVAKSEVGRCSRGADRGIAGPRYETALEASGVMRCGGLSVARNDMQDQPVAESAVSVVHNLYT